MAKDTRKLNIVVAVRDQTKKTLGGVRKRLRATAKNMAADWQILWHAKIKQSLERMVNNVKAFAAKVRRIVARAIKVIAAAITAGVTLAFALLTREVKKQFAEIDRLAKTAIRFGVAIENIRALELAANLAGLSLSEMTTILRDTARRVSEAAIGTGEAQDAIKELGLDARQLNLLPVEQQLDAILAALGKVKNQNDRVRIAYDVMGRSGTMALTMVGKSIHEARLETELLGTQLDTDITRNVQDANDEIVRMKSSFSGLAQVITGTIAPVITKIAKQVKQLFIEIRFGIQAIPITLEIELLKLQQKFQKAGDAIKRTQLGALLLGKPTAVGIGRVGEGGRVTDPIQERIDALLESLDNLARLPGNLADGEAPEGPDETATRRRVTPPALTQGRLITGAAQSGAERLAAIAKEADEKRRREAQKAEKQREENNRLLGDLLRSALKGNTNMGTLLQ